MNLLEEQRLMTINEVASLLSVKVSWIRAAIFKREIPYIKIGHHVRFKKEELTAWIKSNRIDLKE